ncbi:MAG: hypothetical protein AAB538_03175, partial [Patescibacteria group bacterium]
MNKLFASILVFAMAALVAPSAWACNTMFQPQPVVVQPQPVTAQQTAAVGFTGGSVAPGGSVATNSTQNNTVVAQSGNQQQGVVQQGSSLTAVDATQGALAVVANPTVNNGTVVTNINQHNEVNLGPKPTPTPTPPPMPEIKANDFVALLVTDGLSQARPGQKITLLVKMRNNLFRDVAISTVRVNISPFIIPNPETMRGHEDLGASTAVNPKSRTVEWQNFILSAQSEITFAIDVEVEAFAPNGYELFTSALLNGDGVFQVAEDKTLVQRIEAIAAAQVVAPQPP